MDKSLLSKLLAGVMSLGMITGGSSIKNVCAMEKNTENDYDLDSVTYENVDLDDFGEIPENEENYEALVSKKCRKINVADLILDLLNPLGPLVGHTYKREKKLKRLWGLLPV